MDYEIFLEGVKNYNENESQYQQDYMDFILESRQVWENLENVSENNVKKIIIEFLERWKIRNPNQIDQKELKMTLRNLSGFSQSLSQRELLGLDFVAEDLQEGESDSELIRKMYEKIKGVYGIGPTSTSKILHGINPSVFMIWDNKVRSEYGFAKNSFGYLRFMFESQKILESIINNYQQKHSCNSETAFNKIIEEANTKKQMSLTRLLDQYNFVKFHQKTDLPSPCPNLFK